MENQKSTNIWRLICKLCGDIHYFNDEAYEHLQTDHPKRCDDAPHELVNEYFKHELVYRSR